MSEVRLVPLGVGDAFSRRSYSTCLALDTRDGFLLIDCPHPTLKMLDEAARSSGADLRPERLLGVVLTHLHADHASGLESLAYFCFFVLRQKLQVLTHPTVAARLWEGHLAAGMEQLLLDPNAPPIEMKLDSYIDVRPLDTNGVVSLGPFSIECRPTVHHIPTTAVRIRVDGRRLGYSADTTFDPELIAWLMDSDLVLHETGPGIHTPYERLIELPETARSRMRLVHYPDELVTRGSVIPLLQQGELLIV